MSGAPSPGLECGGLEHGGQLGLAGRDDEKLRESARATLGKLPPPILTGALTADLPGSVILSLASLYATNHEVTESLLRMPRISGSSRG